jgi:SAM-dependent methyltransferase
MAQTLRTIQPTAPTTVYEPLIDSAPISFAAAPKTCAADDGTGHSCAWYHGLIQYLRLLDVVEAPTANSDFLLRNFRALASAGDYTRVLVSGSADYSTAAHVLAGYRQVDAEPEISVIDRCETPLMINRWYGKQERAAITTESAALLDYVPAEPFDVVTTHCFLGYFTHEERPRAIAKWADCLRPGGKVVTVNVIRPGSMPDIRRFTPEMIDAFAQRTLRAAQACGGFPGLPPEDLEARARVYAGNFWNYPVREEAEVRALFEDNGFTLDFLDMGEPPEGNADGTSGSTVKGALRYVSIVATRT